MTVLEYLEGPRIFIMAWGVVALSVFPTTTRKSVFRARWCAELLRRNPFRKQKGESSHGR